MRGTASDNKPTMDPDHPDSQVEWCEDCETDTPHDVEIKLVTESKREQNTEFSREPYRVSSCVVCGTEERLRMNNA